ncbi:MAG TPA: hypothetical protein VIS72_06960 [Anaerolineales bacterium]
MEEGWNLSPILIPLLALLVGWAIGFFDSNIRTSKKVRQAEDSAKAAMEAAEKKIAQLQAKQTSAAESPAVPENLGLMRIKNENGRLALDLDGIRVDTSAITTEQRKRLVEMLNAMRPWLEGKPAPAPAPMTPPPSKPAPVPAPIASPPPQPVSQPQASVSKPSASSSKRKDDEPEVVPTSIVGQINTILQYRIANTPLESRGVSLMESLSGGVNVYVGIQRYEMIDDVPDEEVKTAIRAAIAEWENKFTPGLK